jgi:hypothetical protein
MSRAMTPADQPPVRHGLQDALDWHRREEALHGAMADAIAMAMARLVAS